MIQNVVDFPPTVNVVLGDQKITGHDFLCIVHKEDGSAGVYYNTDALQLGLDIRIVTDAFSRLVANCTPEEQKEIIKTIQELEMSRNGQDRGKSNIGGAQQPGGDVSVPSKADAEGTQDTNNGGPDGGVQ